MSLLTVEGIEASYGSTKVLVGVDLDVDDGTIVALLGTNGAGKSTILRAISGLLPIEAGSIVFDGERISGLRPEEIVARGVVQMPGGKAVFPSLTVDENIRLAGWLRGRDDPHLADAVEAAFERFPPVLGLRRGELAGNLSGGEQQMVGLCQALIAQPRLLMVDELSLGLAPVVVEQLLDLVRELRDAGTSIILVEQSVNVALTLAESAYFLERGKIRFHGATRDLLDRPDLLRAVFLEGQPAASRTRPRTARTTATGEEPCPTCERGRKPVLQVSGLSVSFGGNQAVRSVDLTLLESDIVGIIGPNGAGKTTLFDAISGFVDAACGTVTVNGVDVTNDKPDMRARAGLGRSFQDARLFPAMTVGETIAVACERHVKTRDPIAAGLSSAATKIAERLVAQEVDRLIDLVGLGRYRDTFVAALSTGTRRIVDLACVLAHQPAALLLDEPSSGIAQAETEALAAMIQDIRRQTGAGVVVIEHDIPLVSAISDRLIAMVLGEMVVSGNPEAVVSHPTVVEAYLGSTPEVINRSGRQVRRRRRERPLVATREIGR